MYKEVDKLEKKKENDNELGPRWGKSPSILFVAIGWHHV